MDKIEKLFRDIKTMMRLGIPFYKACESLGINRNSTYIRLNSLQRKEIIEIRALCTKDEYIPIEGNPLPYKMR